MKLYPTFFFCFCLILLNSYGQAKNDSIYTDFDCINFKTIHPAAAQQLFKKGYYIRNLPVTRKSKHNVELIQLYRDSGKLHTRKAGLINTGYGQVFAFKVMKEPGYEKVLIFADWDYHHDSLLIHKDSLYFKAISDGFVELSLVYPSKNDTIKIKRGYRDTRRDFLKKFHYQPALKNYSEWFSGNDLDGVETFTLVKKDSMYELIQIETSRDRTEYEYKDLKEKYATAGGTVFWLAVAELSY